MARIPRKDREATEDGWLMLRRGGMTFSQIAGQDGHALSTVWQGVQDARDREARLVPAPPQIRPPLLELAFGCSCKALPLLTCGDVHPWGPIPEGSRLCCYACHSTGIDDHPGFKRDPATDPKPEKVTKRAAAWLSRAERRALKRALKSAS